ncbi:MAG: nickel/cobalt transporter [Dehalococcoidia bacterium]
MGGDIRRASAGRRSRSPSFVRWVLTIAGLVLLTALATGVASAHPLGNFTINRYSRVEVASRQVHVLYVIDMAEIPAFQEKQSMDPKATGSIGEGARNAYLAAKIPQLLANLHLNLNDATIPLTAESPSLSFPPGQGGLTTLRLSFSLMGTIPTDAEGVLDLSYRDDNYSERIGWKEIVVRGMQGTAISGPVTSQDVSHELRSYPKDMLSSPLNVRSVRFRMKPGAGATTDAVARDKATSQAGGAVTRAIAVADGAFTTLVTSQTLTLPIILISLLAALALGGLHALSPGHGKTIAGAYLVSSRATGKHALFLGLTVTATHTSSVFLLGLITLTASQFIVPERLYPVLNLASGLIILVIGMALSLTRGRRFLEHRFGAERRVADRRGTISPSPMAEPVLVGAGTGFSDESGRPVPYQANTFRLQHAYGGPGHQHGPGGHTHLPPGAGGRPITWRSLLALGISGGLLPCPSALVVLLSAISLHRLGFGLVLIVAFSVGLATMLVGIGMVLVYARHLFNRMDTEGGFMQLLPVLSALVITLAGVVLTATALGVRGLPVI